MAQKFKLHEVFTPSQPAFSNYVERGVVNTQLLRALKTPGKQLIIYGHTGAGKTTTLANVLKAENLRAIITRCVKGMTLNGIIIDAFSQLEVYFQTAIENTDGGKAGASLGAGYFGIKASFNLENSDSAKSTSKRAVDLPITPQTLAKYIGEASCFWVIEDFHKIDENEKAQMAQIMKVFMDSSVEYPGVKIIAIGAVNTAREVVQYDPEMKNRVSEIYVPLMSQSQLRQIITEGSKLLKITFDPDVIDKIATYSSGLAAVTHQLALLMCEIEGIQETQKQSKFITKETLDAAIEDYINEHSDTLKSTYDSATRVKNLRKYESPKDVLNAILTCPKEHVTYQDVLAAIKKVHPEYKGNNLRKYIEELTTTERGEILRYDKDSYTYHFSNPFLRAYAQFIRKTENANSPTTKTELHSYLKTILKRELEIAHDAFRKDFSVDHFPMDDDLE
ncbi:ATP-binding protein [Fulvivirgaceae bacterium PWU5]|uniref:ATP-binding protein n=1 Tax=Dawidia cretensis TaxID=2782350 RepID=A0AAP2E3F8_9BACT|nr:ATP-binding protein [Dawidia cretensis]MBT1712358.1 ATP-binding protein [Dawidia cretensis]